MDFLPIILIFTNINEYLSSKFKVVNGNYLLFPCAMLNYLTTITKTICISVTPSLTYYPWHIIVNSYILDFCSENEMNFKEAMEEQQKKKRRRRRSSICIADLKTPEVTVQRYKLTWVTIYIPLRPWQSACNNLLDLWSNNMI